MNSKECRFCKSKLNQVMLDLGETPVANSFIDKNHLEEKETKYPLCVFVCEKCFLVQLEEYESPENIFGDYAYFSSYSETWLKHAKDYTTMIIAKFHLKNDSQIIEIASNDGYLLQFFKEKNFPILGIEPAVNVAKSAIEKGITTLIEFFNSETAKQLKQSGKEADLIIGNNVLAHVPNLNDFVQGLKILLKPAGIITMEFPHLLQLIKQTQFDTIYHEHFSYLSLLTTQKIFSHHGLTIFDVEEIPTHGGSLRIYAKHKEKTDNYPSTKNVEFVLNKEKQFGLDKILTYEGFSERVKEVKEKLYDFIISAKKDGKTIVCYGAPAKGNTLLNYCKINNELVDYTVDRSPHKQGLYLPGTHIPIKTPEKITETKPDYLLILPWNLKDEIMTQMSHIRNWNGKFVIPIPKVKIYS